MSSMGQDRKYKNDFFGKLPNFEVEKLSEPTIEFVLAL